MSSFQRRSRNLEQKKTKLSDSNTHQKIKENFDSICQRVEELEKSNDQDKFSFAIVLLFSALDKYISDKFKLCVVEIFNNDRELSSDKNLMDFTISIKYVLDHFTDTSNHNWLSHAIYDSIRYKSYQKYDKIIKVLSYIVDRNEFKAELRKHIKDDFSTFQNKFNEYNKKRNDIVHNYDSKSIEKHEISYHYVKDCRIFIQDFTLFIDNFLKIKNT